MTGLHSVSHSVSQPGAARLSGRFRHFAPMHRRGFLAGLGAAMLASALARSSAAAGPTIAPAIAPAIAPGPLPLPRADSSRLLSSLVEMRLA